MPAITAGAASGSALFAAAPGITTAWRAPLDPAIMVIVFCSPGAVACLAGGFAAGAETLGGTAAGFSAAGVDGRIAMRAIGSPPSGVSLKMAKTTKRNKTEERRG